MEINLRIKKNRSLKENAARVIPPLYDLFISHSKETLKGKPEDLHKMRVTGKYLRYGLELFEPLFGRQYAGCFEEVRIFIEIMGRVHDLDIALDRTRETLSVIRIYNNRAEGKGLKIKTSKFRHYIADLKTRREKLFSRLVKTLSRWEIKNFRLRLNNSLTSRIPK